MKEWLRAHPGHLPPGIDPGEHSHYIRDLLVQSGWRVEESLDEVRLYAPESASPKSTAPPTPSPGPAVTPTQPTPVSESPGVPPGDRQTRLQTVKLVLEIVATAVAVIGAILALFLRSK
jgi:hypothetical protein